MQNPYPQITQIPQILKRHLPNSAQLRKESLNNQCNLRNLRIGILGVLQEALKFVLCTPVGSAPGIATAQWLPNKEKEFEGFALSLIISDEVAGNCGKT